MNKVNIASAVAYQNTMDTENGEIEIEKEEKLTYTFFKRVLDIVIGIIGIIVLIPLTIFILIANMINKDKGPIFYKQERIGKNGKIFKIYKYRTMVVDAEKILERHIKEQTEIGKEYERNKKLKNDPRITKIGKVLRKASLDEFPQFINVIKGEMSVVGPRPYLLRERKDMGSCYGIIIDVKPGITGKWQTAGRNNIHFQGRLELDAEYCKERSFGVDVKIILRTIKTIITRKGAI